jgi:hypothetical protein
MNPARRIAVLAGAVVGLGLPVLAVAAPPLPGSDYTWGQPGTALVDIPDAQPPAWIPIAPTAVSAMPVSDYRWAQPWTAPVTTPSAQPPEWIPIG